MIVIQSYEPTNCRNGQAIDVDSHRSVAVYENDGAYWVDILNGELIRSIVMSPEVAEAVVFLLATKLGWAR